MPTLAEFSRHSGKIWTSSYPLKSFHARRVNNDRVDILAREL